jgi:hypothetical protein
VKILTLMTLMAMMVPEIHPPIHIIIKAIKAIKV